MSELVERFNRIQRDEPARLVLHARSEARVVTASALWREAEAIVGALTANGLVPGQLLVSVAGNRAAFYSLLLACLACGVPVMPVDRGTTLTEVLELATRFGALGLVLSGVEAGALDALTPTNLHGARRAQLPGGLTLLVLERVRSELRDYRGAAVLKLTSGSTGLPKATFTTDQQLLHDSWHIVEGMGVRPDDTQLGLIPLSHAYGLGSLVVPVFMQGTAVVLRETFVPSHVPEDAAAHGARVFPGVPFMFEHLAAHLPAEAWPRSLDTLVSAGARLDVDAARAFAARFGTKIHGFYGTTETGGICYDATAEVGEVATVGRPLPGVEVSLRAEEGAPPGAGRVHVRSAAVAEGYAGGEDGAATGFADGGYLTGDLGRFDADGRLSLVGRVSSFINVAGRKVQPDEVERVLREMPGIADARVLGIPDARRGQLLVACLVAREAALRPVTIRQYCAARLAPHKIPRAFVYLTELPYDDRGKTNRRALEALVLERLQESRP